MSTEEVKFPDAEEEAVKLGAAMGCYTEDAWVFVAEQIRDIQRRTLLAAVEEVWCACNPPYLNQVQVEAWQMGREVSKERLERRADSLREPGVNKIRAEEP